MLVVAAEGLVDVEQEDKVLGLLQMGPGRARSRAESSQAEPSRVEPSCKSFGAWIACRAWEAMAKATAVAVK